MEESLQISYNTEKEVSKNTIIDHSFGNLTLSDIGISEKKDDINSIDSFISNNKLNNCKNIFINKTKKTKIKKEDLNNIPLPIFSCIYCSNEKISFNHMIKEILEKKYFLLTSIYDLENIKKILVNNNIQNLIVDIKEYIKKYYKYNESKIFLYNYEKIKNNFTNLDNHIIYITNKSTCSNSTYTKFKLEDLLKEQKTKNNNNKLNNARKIKKQDIKWDSKYYNIWNPIPEQLFIKQPGNNVSKNKIKNNNNININKTPIMLNRKKIQLKLYSTLKNKTKEISNKKYKFKIPTYRNQNLTAKKTFQKLINYTYNNTKDHIKINKINKNKFINKNSISKIITRSSSKNKTHNIVVNIKINKTPIKINKTPIKANINKSITKKLFYTTNKQNTFNSQINMFKSTNISPNKKNKKYLNTNPINLFKSTNNNLIKKTLSNKKQTSLNKKIQTEIYSQNSTINKNIKNFKKINVMNLLQYKIKKYYLSKEKQKIIKKNNTLSKIKTSNDKPGKNKSSGFLIVVSPTNKFKNKNISINKSNKFQKKNIEIHLK